MTTATTIVMLVVVVSTVAVVVVTAASTAVAVASTTACHVLDEVVDLLLRGVAVLYYGTLKIQRLACQRVVQIYFHLLFANLHDASVEAVALIVLQGYDSVLVDMLVVEVAVDTERLAVQVEHVFVHIFTIAFFFAQRDVEVLTFGGGNHLLLELVESKAEAGDKGERPLGSSLFNHFSSVVAVDIQLVCSGNVLVCLVVHIPYIL